MVAHPAIAAVPVDGGPDRGLTQAALIARYIAVIFDGEDPEAFEPDNPATGTVAIGLAWQGRIFWYDPLDATTAHDGTTTLVTAGGERYKVTDTDALVRSVLDKDLATPPVSPAIGDAYLVGDAATGDWATHDREAALWTARGWAFIAPDAGDVMYVEDEDEHYKFTSGGAWQKTFTIASNSVAPTDIIGGRTVWIVENDTTNTPPTAPQGTAYIIGDTPTDAWVGHAGKIAFREAAGSGDVYVIHAPAEGWTAYDKAANLPLRHEGTQWASAAGAVIEFKHVFTVSGSETSTGSGGGSYSATTPPDNVGARTEDNATLTHTARKANAVLRFRWHGNLVIGVRRAIGLYRDDETNAIDWAEVGGGGDGHYLVEFVVTAPDTNEHTYAIQLKQTGGTLTRRLFTLEEFA
jgi:hypothetical protein